MALFATRHISVTLEDGLLRTTVRLENEFWTQVDYLAGLSNCSWADWVRSVLAQKPVGVGSASWIRVNCLQGLAHG